MSVEPGAILAAGTRRAAVALPGLRAHRRACPACQLGRDLAGARLLAGLERQAVDWWPAADLASAAGCDPRQWDEHLHAHGLDEVKHANHQGAAARALALAVDGDTQAARVALSALDRLREAAGLRPMNGGPAGDPPAADPEPAAWPGEAGPLA